MKKYRKENKKIFLILGILLLAITIGYATLNATLNINGTSKLHNSTWDIHWNNVQVTQGSVSIGQGDSAATITPNDTTEVTYAVTLNTPGDFYEFTVDAVNGGSIDGMIDTITSTYKIGNGAVTPITSNNLPAYLDYSVTYSDGVAIAQNHKLEANSTETYKVRIEFKKDIDANQLPESAQSILFSFGVNYKQADGNATPVPHSITTYVYTVNKYDDSITTPLYNEVWLNQAIHESIVQYNTPSEALTAIATASSMNLPIYLKHKIENGIVTESYVEFVVTPEMAQANSGMVAGTYTLRGEKTYENGSYIVGTDYISPYYEANKEAIKAAFGYSTNPSRCYEVVGTGHPYGFTCRVSGLDAYAYTRGLVFAGDFGGSSCSMGEAASSSCYWW